MIRYILSNVITKIYAITEYHSGTLLCAHVLSGKKFIIGTGSELKSNLEEF